MRRNDRVYDKIQEIQEREQSVVLSLVCGEEIAGIHFQNGKISAATSNIPRFRLGAYLKESAALEDSGIEKLVLEARRRRMFLGQAAVTLNLIDIETLLAIVQEQAAEIVMHVLEEKFKIRYVGQELIDFYLPARMDTQHLMLLIARKTAGSFSISTNQLIVLKNSADHRHLPWYPEELAVMGLLETPRETQDLLTRTGLGENRLGKILAVFDSLKLIEVVDAPTEATTAIVKHHGFPFDFLVPEIPNNNVSWEMESLLRAHSFASEQFRTLKVRMSAISYDRSIKVITVTSPDNSAGKSLMSANLAVSFSHDPERKTIIVDCDLRRPRLHNLLGCSIEPGLIGYLQDERLQSFCYMRRLESLFLMTAGGRAQDSVELLSLERMRNLIQYLRAEFDTIILDAPPLAPISDTQILTRLSDGLLFVVRSGKTSYTSIERAARSLDESKLIGVVLNDVQPMMFNTQYDSRYYGSPDTGAYPYRTTEFKRGRRLRNYLNT